MGVVVIRGLAEVKAQIKELRLWTRAPAIMLELAELSVKKLGWLAGASRDFLSTDGRMLPEMVKAAQTGLNVALRKKDRTADDMLEPWRRMGAAARDRIAKRLRGGGNDILSSMRPLAAVTVKRKGHGIIGYDTGALHADVASAKVVVRATVAAEQSLLRNLAADGGRGMAAAAHRGAAAAREAGPITLAETRGYRRGLRAAAGGR